MRVASSPPAAACGLVFILPARAVSITAWIVFLLVAAAAGGLVAFFYRTREPAVRHRALLIGLRTLALAILLLLIFDPALPATGRRAPRTVVALDASLSMRLPVSASDSTSRWSAALAAARHSAGDAPVLVFGDGVYSVEAEALDTVAPNAAHSRLLPALRAAAEAGARRLLVVSDGGTEDAADVAAWAARYGIALDVEQIGDARPAARSLTELEAPAWVEAGESVRLSIAVGPGERTSTITATADGAEPASVQVPASAAAGQVQTVELEITPEAPPEGGLVRIDVALDSPVDAVRSVYVQVGGEPAGVALVSLRPDQEPRFLTPVLETALGLPVRGFLRAADGAWIRLGRGTDAAQRATEEDVQRAVAAAELLVLHGAGGSAPEWLSTAATQAGRILVFPAASNVPGIPVRFDESVSDEFYLSTDVPSSPIAPLLSGLDLEGLAPLTELRSAQAEGSAWAALTASRRRRGEPQPITLAGESGGQRWAVALGSGYWGWAFRGEAGRAVYARLWGAITGWLMREEGAIATAALRPVQRSIARGERPHWVAPGLDFDSVRVELSSPERDSALVSVARSAGGTDTLRTTAVPPGHYSYSAAVFAGDSIAGTATGPLTVEQYSPELAREGANLEAAVAQATPVGPGARERGPRRPLHASALPWALLVLVLCGEWVLRRRWGLR